MTAIKLEDFSGLVPRRSRRLLPPQAATTARNTKLLQGELRGYHALRELSDFTNEYFTVRRAYRIPASDDYDDTWLLFDSRDVDVVRSPIINDRYERYYWAGDGRPKYNTLERIRFNLDPYFLGIPQPDTAPSVTPAAGSTSTRAYVYTFVSAYGEEGPVSDATLATGDAGSWTIGNLDTTPTNSSSINITKKRIYRTVIGNTSQNYFLVAEVSLATSSYVDTFSDDVVASNSPLESTSWFGPPSDLEGFVAMPNGYLVGWVGRRLLFSEPYRPWAWPPEYELATEFEIVGLVVWGTALIIGTRSNPYIGGGVTPAAFTTQKMDAVEPCLSRRGMVATVAGAYYPSINGLILANSNGTQVITQDLLTKEEWARYSPSDIYASQLGLQYIAFVSPSFGFVFNPTEPQARLIELDRFEGVNGIETDRYTGNVNIIMQDRAWDWDPETSERLYWRWKSKEFHFPKPLNFGALKIKFDTGVFDVTEDVQGYYGPYNATRFGLGFPPGLNTLGGHGLDMVQGTSFGPAVTGWTEPENRMPLGGDPLYPINFMLQQVPSVRFVAYAGGVKVYDHVVTHENMIRLPTGFKRDVWQFELMGNTICYSISIAESGKELASV